MGPNENPTRHGERQAANGRKRSSRRPRTRRCLLKDAHSGFAHDMRGSGIAAMTAARRRAHGRSGRPGRSTGSKRRANRSGVSKAGATGSASKTENHQKKRPFRRPRGSSLRSFFDHACNRPGCYECFVRSRRSPLLRFCSPACQRAMERVWERERRWHRRRARRRPHPGRWPRERLP
jgi:hypothetical protein